MAQEADFWNIFRLDALKKKTRFLLLATNNILALEPTEKSDEDSSNENTSLVSEEDRDSKLNELPPKIITK